MISVFSFSRTRVRSLTRSTNLALSVSKRRSLATHMSPTVSSNATENWVPVHSDGDPSSNYSAFARPIIQSPHDDRSYRIIQLPNNLQALLVSDPSTDKAAASLSVGVGHLSDPDDRPGLAHFCEHLLFMVSK